MNIKVQHLLKTASVLLILVVALSGQIPTDMQVEAWQNSPGEGKRVGRGDFPRLPVVMPGADGSTLSRGIKMRIPHSNVSLWEFA